MASLFKKIAKGVLTGGASLIAEKAKKSKGLKVVLSGGASLVVDKLKQKKAVTGKKPVAASQPVVSNLIDSQVTLFKGVDIDPFENNAPPMITDINNSGVIGNIKEAGKGLGLMTLIPVFLALLIIYRLFFK